MKRLLALSMMLSFLGLSGCARQDMAELQGYIADVKARPPGPVAPLPAIRTAESFAYSSDGLKDPFAQVESLVPEEPVPVASGPQPDLNRPRQELEQYSLDTLSMVGTLEQQGTRWGLVSTTDGVIHKVKPGNYAGQNHGRIIRIDEERVQLVELVEVAPGRYQEREAELAINN